mgnify:CR=1 FL=1
MIKCDGTSVELRGKGIDILTDLGVLTEPCKKKCQGKLLLAQLKQL